MPQQSQLVLKSCDLNGVNIVCLYCCECDGEFGSNSSDHNKSMIINLFTNFIKNNLSFAAHIRSWCLKRGFHFSFHLMFASKKECVVMIVASQKRLITKEIKTLEVVKSTVKDNMKPFPLIGNLNNLHLKSFWYKVKCLFYNDFFNFVH